MKKDLLKMSKKELKEYVNKNGFFQKLSANKISYEEANALEFSDNAITTGVEMPKGDNIILFKGVASQNYKKGEKSRNNYKIDQKGWDFNAYFNNPIILLQHNAEYGGIGRALKFGYNKAGDLTALFYVDKNTIENESTKYQIENNYITGISTGHITNEFMIEDNETGERYTMEEAQEKFGWENVFYCMIGYSDALTMVVTDAQMCEVSLVTIGSNEKAIAEHNTLGDFMSNKAHELANGQDASAVKEALLINSVRNGMVDLNKIMALTNEFGMELTVDEIKGFIEEHKNEIPEEKVEVETPAVETPAAEVETPAVEEEAPATETNDTDPEVETPAVEVDKEPEAPAASPENGEAIETNDTEVETDLGNDSETPVVVAPEAPEAPVAEVVTEEQINAVKEMLRDEFNTILTNALMKVDEKIAAVRTELNEKVISEDEMNGLVEILEDLGNNVLSIRNAQKNVIVDGVKANTTPLKKDETKTLGALGQKLKDGLERVNYNI